MKYHYLHYFLDFAFHNDLSDALPMKKDQNVSQ